MSLEKSIGVAKILAILALFVMSSPKAYAENLALPQIGSDAVTLRSPGHAPFDAAVTSDILRVFVGTAEACCAGRIPIAGRYAEESGAITFTPAFGFEAEQDYVARVQMPGQEERLVSFRIPTEQVGRTAEVSEFFPSGDTLPENVLRFYIHFSVPMQPHVAFDFIKLRDSTGNADDAAFMRFKQELWNEDRTRLTVLIDPGRIKREVATNRTLGPALRAGQYYTLSVEGGWRSADGTSVLPPFSKTFLVSDPLRTRPDAGLWRSNSPCMGTSEPLEITFDRSFDRHLLTSKLRVIAKTGHQIEGDIEVRDGERTWRFIPNQPWSGTDLQLAAETSLEDIAGNNFLDLLDHITSDQVAVATSTDIKIELTNCSD